MSRVVHTKVLLRHFFTLEMLFFGNHRKIDDILLQVIAIDGGSGEDQLTTRVPVNITIADVNNKLPRFIPKILHTIYNTKYNVHYTIYNE